MDIRIKNHPLSFKSCWVGGCTEIETLRLEFRDYGVEEQDLFLTIEKKLDSTTFIKSTTFSGTIMTISNISEGGKTQSLTSCRL